MGLKYDIDHGGKYLPAQELTGLVKLQKKQCVCGWLLPEKVNISVIATMDNFLPNKGVLGIMTVVICPKCGYSWNNINNKREMTPVG